MAKELDNNVEVEATVVDLDSVDETVEDSGRDYLKDGLAIGLGLLALDGAVHVSKFAWDKGIKPACKKVKAGFNSMKQKAADKKAAKAEAKVNKDVENTAKE